MSTPIALARARTTVVMGLVGLVAGLVGVLLALGARHAWQDHAALHELAVIELQRQQQGQQAK